VFQLAQEPRGQQRALAQDDGAHLAARRHLLFQLGLHGVRLHQARLDGELDKIRLEIVCDVH